MKLKRSPAFTAAFCGVCAALALGLAYLEFLLPSLWIPGVRLGLANVVTVFLLYSDRPAAAACVSAVRILLAALLFGSVSSFCYSLAGGILSLSGMILLRRLRRLSIPAVSCAGGILHNLAQLTVASLLFGYPLMGTVYLPVLLLSGAVTGVLMGLAAAAVIFRLPSIFSKKSN